MSLATQIQTLVTRIADEFKTVAGRVGVLANLTTTAKGSLVAAINEVAAAGGSGGAAIDDATPGLTTVYSSTKTQNVVDTAIAALVDGAPTALNTLKEIADELAADDTAMASLLTSVGVRVRYDAAQTLTAPEQAQARTNIGAASAADVGDTTTDFVADFDAALIA